MVQITEIVQKYTPEISKQVRETVSEPTVSGIAEISKTASEGISNLQKGLIKATYPKLDRTSKYCKFFGTDSAHNVQHSLENHMALSVFKGMEQNLVKFPTFVVDTEEEIARREKEINRYITRLQEKGAGRWTIFSKIFGENGAVGTHTVGLISEKDRLWVLDSLPESYNEVKNYHDTFKKIFGKRFKEVHFLNKNQQTLDEYTCNNWTHANLEAVLKYKSKNPENNTLNKAVLDKILPRDINKILKEQTEFVEKKLNGRSLFDIIVEERLAEMNKKAEI